MIFHYKFQAREKVKENKKWPKLDLNLELRMREYVSSLCKSSPNSIITLFFAKDFASQDTDDQDDQRKSREPTWACPVTVGVE